MTRHSQLLVPLHVFAQGRMAISFIPYVYQYTHDTTFQYQMAGNCFPILQAVVDLPVQVQIGFARQQILAEGKSLKIKAAVGSTRIKKHFRN
jgi:hypothetical protein